ncbi:MAG TPA: hypothetical protein PLB78_01075 [Anaerolineae bacterium]|nr:hypothetical protein [Anaerolineae bacterium]
MYSFTSLEIAGYRGEPLPHTFLRQAEETRHLGVIFPGWGYTADRPVLYYPGLLLLDRGADLLRVEYNYVRRPDYLAATEADREEWLIADVSAALEAGLAQRAYSEVTLVGKSIGTLAMGHLLAGQPRLEGARALWLTPLLRNERLLEQIGRWGGRSLFVAGTADPHYDPARLEAAVAATHGRQLRIDGADHSLEIAGNTLQTVEAMLKVVRAVEMFLTTQT